MRFVYASFFLALATSAVGQTIENVKAAFAEGKVTITYDITGGNPKQKYKIDLYSSHNGFSYPLKNVKGDAGADISSGVKSIVWDATTELQTYTGQVTFKVKGEMIALAFAFTNPSSNGFVRRGKNSLLQWEGGIPGKDVKLEIYQGSTLVATVAETKNTGQYNWAVPKDLKQGKDYTLKISDNQQAVTSSTFAVKAKIPLLLKLSPILIGAAIIPFLGGSSPDPDPLPVKEKLAAAPDPS